MWLESYDGRDVVNSDHIDCIAIGGQEQSIELFAWVAESRFILKQFHDRPSAEAYRKKLLQHIEAEKQAPKMDATDKQEFRRLLIDHGIKLRIKKLSLEKGCTYTVIFPKDLSADDLACCMETLFALGEDKQVNFVVLPQGTEIFPADIFPAENTSCGCDRGLSSTGSGSCDISQCTIKVVDESDIITEKTVSLHLQENHLNELTKHKVEHELDVNDYGPFIIVDHYFLIDSRIFRCHLDYKGKWISVEASLGNLVGMTNEMAATQAARLLVNEIKIKVANLNKPMEFSFSSIKDAEDKSRVNVEHVCSYVKCRLQDLCPTWTGDLGVCFGTTEDESRGDELSYHNVFRGVITFQGRTIFADFPVSDEFLAKPFKKVVQIVTAGLASEFKKQMKALYPAALESKTTAVCKEVKPAKFQPKEDGTCGCPEEEFWVHGCQCGGK